MIQLTEEMIPTIKGIIYFKNKGKIHALLNTYTNLYSYMEDLSKDNQDFFNDLSNDTKDEDNVFIYNVEDNLMPMVSGFLSKSFIKTNRYDYLDELDAVQA